jgi:hypothetical protein
MGYRESASQTPKKPITVYQFARSAIQSVARTSASTIPGSSEL